jgi:hypothetical protein
LRQAPAYQALLGLQERVFDQQARILFTALPHDKYLFQCGVVFAIQRLIELPDEIIATVTKSEDHAHARDTSETDRSDGNTAYLNTPWADLWGIATRTNGGTRTPGG